MRGKILIIFTLLFAQFTSAKDYTRFVDPMIGSDYHGNVFVGASVPFGMVQAGPTNMSTGWHWCSGYHYSDSTIIGFSHTHLNGTGIGDLGDILLMPSAGKPTTYKGNFNNLQEGYVSLFSHKEEVVKPGYYAVKLKKHGIKAELTATERVGYHKYTFPTNDNPHIVIDLKEGIGWDEPTQTYLKQLDSRTVEGFRYSSGWAKNQKIYFHMVFSKDISLTRFPSGYFNTRLKDSVQVDRGIASFRLNDGEAMEVKVAISYVSCANAAENMQAELPGWDFKQTVAAAQKKWNAELSKIEVETIDDKSKIMFYTSLFRTMISPSIFADVNGDYRGADGKVYRAAGFTPYTIFSLWDTYRTFHPLQTILNPKRSADWVNSLLDITERQGSLPIWHLVGNETGTMVGVHAIPVIADAVLKDIPGIDAEKAYRAIRTFVKRNDRGLKFVREKGWIPADLENWSVSKALEYAIDDYAIALVAKKLGKEADYQLHLQRSKLYREYFDPKTGFLRGKLADGTFRKDYNPSFSLHEEADYVEGNGWQYSFLVPHDPAGLIELYGGNEPFTKKLDSLFTVSSSLNEGASIDISGLIGQYAHGNEPSHSTIYLYSMAGKPEKTALRVRQVLTSMYKPQPDGLCGNDDCGQMSAWYVCSALGFYPMNPVSGDYVFGSPLVKKATIRLDNGKKIVIHTRNQSQTNYAVESVRVNGKVYTDNQIPHKLLMNGAKLFFSMKKASN